MKRCTKLCSSRNAAKNNARKLIHALHLGDNNEPSLYSKDRYRFLLRFGAMQMRLNRFKIHFPICFAFYNLKMT